MCGINGIITGANSRDIAEKQIAAMNDSIVHRGPDDDGIFLDVDGDKSIAFGMRRLSIIDLSTGKQPIFSQDKQKVIVFNGEVYNFKALRAEMEGLGHTFRGHSDTEVLLAAISEWGLERALSDTVGMFAFALWDRFERTLYLARDRAGEKPLYYGKVRRSFVFASELSAIDALPSGDREIDRNALGLRFEVGSVRQSPRCVVAIPSHRQGARRHLGRAVHHDRATLL